MAIVQDIVGSGNSPFSSPLTFLNFFSWMSLVLPPHISVVTLL